MSTPGPERVPSKVKVDKTSGQGKPPAGGDKPKPGAKSTGAKPGAARPGAARPGAAKPGAKGGGKGRKPVTPVKVSGSTNWGPIAIGGVVGVVVLAILGYAVFSVVRGSRSWEDKAADIKGIVNYRAQKNAALESRNHKDGTLTYVTTPPVGGDHNPLWQNCMGDVYDQAIANEHAVHSLEHGAVWVTYKPGIPQDQIDDLKSRARTTCSCRPTPASTTTSPCRSGATSSSSTTPPTRASTSSSRTRGSTPPWSPARPAPAATRPPAR
jgi:hypothetical protein